jgi:hypothetical protein
MKSSWIASQANVPLCSKVHGPLTLRVLGPGASSGGGHPEGRHSGACAATRGVLGFGMSPLDVCGPPVSLGGIDFSAGAVTGFGELSAITARDGGRETILTLLAGSSSHAAVRKLNKTSVVHLFMPVSRLLPA